MAETQKLAARPRRLRLGNLVLGSIFIFSVPVMSCLGEDAPKPDPAGIATGDKTTVSDGGGTPFVEAQPADKTEEAVLIRNGGRGDGAL